VPQRYHPEAAEGLTGSLSNDLQHCRAMVGHLTMMLFQDRSLSHAV
jgi:hypothetical protein